MGGQHAITGTLKEDIYGSQLFKGVHPNRYPDHSTIICQLDEAHSDFDRRCHLEDVCWDRRESTFV